MVNSPYYDNLHWEYHLPIQPGPSEEDIDSDTGLLYSYRGPDRCDVSNWLVDGKYVFESRLKENVQHE